MKDPKKEFDAAILAFQDTKKLYGTLQLPAACSFPARKYILEKHLGQKFPNAKCKDLDDWITRINADHLAIDFAGAYSGNPASILGHTFLRFYKSSNQDRRELLSHAVGFLAVSPPEDSRALYMVRGLTGQYPGYYQIEPFYMKVGIYNNSESRDIWEQPLNLTPEEIKLTLMLLWEYSFNAEIPYYFIDENCSYRLLSLLEVVRPESELLSELSPVVLPADTVRVLIKKGFSENPPKFRSSILRRLNKKVETFSEAEKTEFDKAKNNLSDLEKVNNENVLDALIDFWTYTNYRAQTDLSESQSKLMEETFLKRAKIFKISSNIQDELLMLEKNLRPTFMGHKTSSFALSSGVMEFAGQNHSEFKGSYRMGAHSLTDSLSGYEDIAAIDYLGFDIESRGKWKALLVDAKSLEPLNRPERKLSWSARIGLENDADYSEYSNLYLKGGAGGSYEFKNIKIYLLPELVSETWVNSKIESLLGVGFETGALIYLNNQTIHFSSESTWNRYGLMQNILLKVQHHFNLNCSLILDLGLRDFDFENVRLRNTKIVTLGYKQHF